MDEMQHNFRKFCLGAGIFLSLGTVINVGFSIYGKVQREKIQTNVSSGTNRVETHLDRIELKVDDIRNKDK